MNPRLRRLHADYEQVREAFSGHPHVLIQPVGTSMPPDRYLITYKLRGLTLQDSQPVFREEHQVELHLPLKYPAEKPQAVPVSPIFHPNIREYFCIQDYWAAGTTLRDIIEKMGDMIQWRIYNPKSPLDGVAAQWAVENEQVKPPIFPIGNVDLGVGDIEIETVGETHTPEPSATPQAPEAPASDSNNGAEASPSSSPDGDFDIVFK